MPADKDHGISYTRAKRALYDLGLEVALILRWPAGGIKGGRTCDQLLSNIDILPTLLQLVGLRVPNVVQDLAADMYCEDADGVFPPAGAVDRSQNTVSTLLR